MMFAWFIIWFHETLLEDRRAALVWKRCHIGQIAYGLIHVC
jgi:hypothetical protein